VDDLVDGIYRLFSSDYVEPVNIGNPTELTVSELADLVVELTGDDVGIEYRSLPEDDPKVRQPDISLARELLGWEPRIPVREGLKKTLEYFADLLDRPSSESDG
jgi:dTDP-glucose 4,6-dehydratase